MISQVRFPTYSKFVGAQSDVVNKFAVAISDEYPLFESGHEQVLRVSAEGVSEHASRTALWRFTSKDSTWQVSLGTKFISLTTSSYSHRSDFSSRLAFVWSALMDVAPPPYVERVGVRYVNRVADPELIARLRNLVRPEVIGICGLDDGDAVLERALTDTSYLFADRERFVARFGVVPPGVEIDPSVPTLQTESWVLDSDSSKTWPERDFAGNSLADIVESLALRPYQFFRWAVTQEFLREFGGEV